MAYTKNEDITNVALRRKVSTEIIDGSLKHLKSFFGLDNPRNNNV